MRGRPAGRLTGFRSEFPQKAVAQPLDLLKRFPSTVTVSISVAMTAGKIPSVIGAARASSLASRALARRLASPVLRA